MFLFRLLLVKLLRLNLNQAVVIDIFSFMLKPFIYCILECVFTAFHSFYFTVCQLLTLRYVYSFLQHIAQKSECFPFISVIALFLYT